MLHPTIRGLCCTSVLAISSVMLTAHAELPALKPIQTISPLPSDIVTRPGVEPRAAFGHATAMSGDIALIGMPENLVDMRGSVITYHRGLDGVWKRSSRLDGVAGEASFGYAIAFRDNIAAIASGNAVYVYKHQATTPEWKLLRRLAPAFAGAQAVDYQAGRLVIGSFGSAFVYDIDRATGNVLRKSSLVAADHDPEDAFGFSVALANDTVVVGAIQPGGPETPSGTGAAYVFKLIDGQWRQRQKLIPAGGVEGEGFGFSVAIDKGMIIVGSPGHNTVGAPYDPPTDIPVAGGAAFVYTPDAGVWKLRSLLRPTALQDPFYVAFGLQVVMFDTRVAVTAARPLPVNTLDDRYLAVVFAYERSGSDLHAFGSARPEAGLRIAGQTTAVSINGMKMLVGSPLSQCSLGGGCIGHAVTFDLRDTTP